MSSTDTKFTGSIPEIYDSYLVPLIFETYADDIATRISGISADAILETAAGSGVVTRAILPVLKSTARYAVTDLNAPMLDRARSQMDEDTRIEWLPADAMDLPFDDNAFDVVVCQFGVMFFPDRPGGYREARRVLKPGGKFIFNVWDAIATNVFADVVTQAASTVFADDPPVFLARTPHGHHNKDQIRADALAAGFSNVEIETLTHDSTAPTPRHPAIAYCQGTPLRNEIEARDADKVDHVTDVAARWIEERFGSDQVSGPMQAHIIVASG